MAEKIILSWSGGKDSSLALYELQKQGYEISALLTTITEDYGRISMHGVRVSLLEKQVQSLGLNLERVLIPKDASNEIYESRMRELLLKYKSRGVSSVAFGDIFLEDLKKYREEKLSRLNMRGVFPLWKQNTNLLAKKFIDLGFKAVVTCVDSTMLDGSFAGQKFDENFLASLPPSCDPCGENGEFHSFVYDGPIFRKQISFFIGEKVLRDNRFYFCDLVPND